MTEINEILRLDKLQSGPRRQSRAATADECAAVSERLGLDAVKAISFDLAISQTPDRDIYEAIGQATMTATRVCSVTNDPFDDVTQTAIHELFTPNAKKATSDDAEIEADTDALDVELLEEDAIDIGELVAQYLALELDPSPRSPASYASGEERAPDDAPTLGVGRTLPFAGLADMLRGDGPDGPGGKN